MSRFTDMNIGPFTRGATVRIRFQFLDAEDDPINPSSAELHLDFLTTDGRGERTVALTLDAGYWKYEWDSAEAEPGIVYGYVHTPPPVVSTMNLRFQLLSNLANAAARVVDV